MDKVISGVRNIHLVGIGGIGVSGLALLLKEKGYRISGSDAQENYSTNMLRENGITVYIGHKTTNLAQGIDLVCYSSAVKNTNPEILEALKRGITILSRGKLLGLLCMDKKTIAVSGSHGKTTTSALTAYLLTVLGYKPAVFVGGLPLNYGYNAWWGQDYFVIETDESDGTFLCYNPWISIITNIDHEHLDYHRDMEGLKKSFLQFAYQTKGLVIGCADDILVEDILSQVKGLSYGFSEKNKITAKNILFEKEASSSESSPYAGFTSFDFFIGGEFINRVKIPLFGRHNVLNTLSVLGLLDYLGEDLDKAIGLLRYFKGTKRRFQVKKQVAGITFIDDYAHHPTEIKAVLEAARYLKPKRIFVVFQPHRFSRVKSLYQEFSHCFSSVDKLIVTDIYSAQEIEIDGISGLFLTEEINKNFASQALYIPKERLISEVPLLLEQGDMVLGLGAGDINIIMDGIIYEFQNNRIKA